MGDGAEDDEAGAKAVGPGVGVDEHALHGPVVGAGRGGGTLQPATKEVWRQHLAHLLPPETLGWRSTVPWWWQATVGAGRYSRQPKRHGDGI